ncbi:MAG TPA: 50S ribosomal protein L21 [Thermodesulfobacteriota bacterium]|nr:50S ribosomal protein L21 [Thermodesulfobacteriota bacterium]
MYAVIRSGGKQYRVTPGEVVRLEKLEGRVGDPVTLDEVLLIGSGDGLRVGTPTVAGARVSGEIVAQERGPKVLVFKKKRRKGYSKLRGHRQWVTAVRITAISEG